MMLVVLMALPVSSLRKQRNLVYLLFPLEKSNVAFVFSYSFYSQQFPIPIQCLSATPSMASSSCKVATFLMDLLFENELHLCSQ